MGKKQNNRRKNQDEKKQDQTCNTRNPPDDSKNLIAEANKDDLITSLPDDILRCIVSLLPLESAITTSFLSSEWKNLWRTNLAQNGTVEDAVMAIQRILIELNDLHQSQDIWGFKFKFHQGYILLASVNCNRKPHLDFSTEKQEFLRQLEWHLNLNCLEFIHLPLTLPPSSTLFVRSLHLVSVSCHTNEAVSSLVSNLQYLETLVIANCNGLESLQIVASSKLRNLTVFDCLQLKSLDVKASWLDSFRFRGELHWFSFDLVFFLSDAILDFRKGPTCSRKFFFGAKSVKILTLSRWTFEELIFPVLPRINSDLWFYQFHSLWSCQFHSLKELWWIDYWKDDEEYYNSDELIYFLRLCPKLETLSVTIDPKSYQVSSRGTAFFTDINTRDVRFNLNCLKVVKLVGFRSQEDEILLAEKLKEVFAAEPRMVATSNGNSWRSLVKVMELQKRTFSYKFVEEVKHINGLCPMHPHMCL